MDRHRARQIPMLTLMALVVVTGWRPCGPLETAASLSESPAARGPSAPAVAPPTASGGTRRAPIVGRAGVPFGWFGLRPIFS